MTKMEYQRQRQMTEYSQKQTHQHQVVEGKIDDSLEQKRNYASAQHAQSHQQSSDGPSKSKYDLPMSSYHPVISQDFNPLKTTMGQADDDLPNESALYRQINQSSNDMHYRAPTGSDRSLNNNYKVAQQAPTPQYGQMVTEKGSYKGMSSNASKQMLNQFPNGQSQTTISDDELSDYSSSMDLNNQQQNQGRYMA